MVMAKMAMEGGKPKKKSNFTYGSGNAPTAKKTVVKQDMIDFIKSQGMTAALKRAGSIQAKGKRGEAEFLEGVRRLYGASRLEAATKAAASTKAKPKAYGANNAPKYRPATANSTKSTGMPGKGPTARITQAAAKKKSTTTDPFARAVFAATGVVGRTFTPEWKKKEAAMKAAAKNKNK